MIAEFITRFEANKDKLRLVFQKEHPDSYLQIVSAVIEAVVGEDEDESPSSKRITEIDEGNYQGTLVYVIGAGGYQPDEYWYVKVGYGSCSGCDTLQAISSYSEGPPSESQVDQYMMLATHVLQGLKRMGDDDQSGPYA